MVSDSVTIYSSSNPKEFAKKKRVNRSAKLKQCKLDVRREQWLSQVKNKVCKVEANGQGGTVDLGIERERTIVKLESKPMGEEENEESINNYISDTESLVNTPTSHSSSVLGRIGSGASFTGSSCHSSSSSSSGHCCLGSMSGEDEEGDDECLDDWEAIADALAATDEKKELENDILDSPQESNGIASRMGPCAEATNHMLSGLDLSQLQKQESEVNVQRASVSNCRAWRSDDAFRPQSLPNLSKHFSLPMNRDPHFGIGDEAWNYNTLSELTSCPICTEDFDVTDTSFLPCSCGFRLCLFCYKRILEDNDGRCPGCRKQY
ncbi:ubiquitin-protein ligase [Lithospermum erythrorhizon]|uniref:Ubiquitin-protein ligase n=1 Tax=Lithospermum erythrorhizon TaxID=34254 RepID=A0AAV3RK45_LITER